jgi:hypothetical protein
MKKRDRTAEEKKIDLLTKGGMMRLGAQSSHEAATPNPFPYVLFWDRCEGRKGQRCRVLKPGPRVITLEFEDGFTATVNRMAIRRD